MLPGSTTLLSLLVLLCDTLIAQSWQDRTQVDHHFPGSVNMQEVGAADPVHGGALVIARNASVEWDGRSAHMESTWAGLSLGEPLAIACDPTTGLYYAEFGDQSGGRAGTWRRFDGVWAPVSNGQATTALNRNDTRFAYDPVQHTFLAVGGALRSGGGPAGNTLLFQVTPTRSDWQPITTLPQPPSRLGAQLATDLARARVVLFGGRDLQGAPLGDTWEWNGQQWSLAATPIAPPPRWAAGIACDERRHVVVLNGGTDGATAFADTWEWNGTAWTQHASSAHPRQGHCLFFDPLREQVLAWRTGKWAGGNWNDYPSMSAWDGVQWRPLPVSTPLPRFGMGLGNDTVRVRLVLFGGLQNGAECDDTWEWDGLQWNERQPLHRPPARLNAALGYDPLRQRTVMHGGNLWDAMSTRLSDTWEWDGQDWTHVTTANHPRDLSNMYFAFHPASSGLLLVGLGINPTNQYETWRYDAAGWHALDPGAATPGMWAGATVAARNATGEVFLYGVAMGNQPASLWQFQGSWVLREAICPPGPLTGPAFVEEPSSGDLLLAGGDERGSSWSWNQNGWTWLPAPAPFSWANAAIDPLRQLPLAFDSGMHRFTRSPLQRSAGWSGCPGSQGAITLRDLQGLFLGSPDAGIAVANVLPQAPLAFAMTVEPPQNWRVVLGCLVPTQWAWLGAAQANGSGAASVATPVPMLPALRGLQLHLQAIVLDAGATNGVFASSRILSLTLGD